jgi:hypothetical protein
MDKGRVLKVTEIGSCVRVSTSDAVYEYHGMTAPNHVCKEPKPLELGDVVIVKSVTPTSVLVTGPCGCDYLLWDRVGEEGTHTVDNVVAATTWDSPLDLVRQWMIVRFALNTEVDLCTPLRRGCWTMGQTYAGCRCRWATRASGRRPTRMGMYSQSATSPPRRGWTAT